MASSRAMRRATLAAASMKLRSYTTVLKESKELTLLLCAAVGAAA